MPGGAESTKTVILGFDALDFRYLDKFAADLPRLSSLRSTGVASPLTATFPPWTGSAWPSMYTGVDPSHHGVFNFFKHDRDYPDTATLVSRNDVKAPAIWNYLSVQDVPSIVLNVPITHPTEAITGVLIPGYLADEETSGHPSGIREQLDKVLGRPYSIYSPYELADDEGSVLEGCLDLIDLRKRAALELLDRYDWRFAFIQVQKTDTAFHKFSSPRAHRRIYEAADDLLGAVMEVTGDCNVIVCSDHGIGPVTGYKIYLNEILRNQGFVSGARSGPPLTLADKKPALVESNHRETTRLFGRLSETMLSGVLTALDSVGVTPGDMYYTAQQLGVDSTLERIVPGHVLSTVGRGVDWRRSKAYCASQSELGIRLNLEGREPEGVVDRSAYESVRDAIIETLERVRTPDGEPAFEWVKRREEVYDGPYTDRAPDVTFMPTSMNHIVATSLLGREFLPVDTYNHKRDGVFLATGPGIDTSAEVARLSLTDVAPVAMATMGFAIPERMTGAPPPGLLRVPVHRTEYADVPYGTGGDTVTESTTVAERLEDLGYL